MNRISRFIFIITCFLITSVNAAEDFYELALQSYYQKDISTAEIHLKNALKNNPQNVPAKLLLAKVYIEKKSPHLAEQELNEALLKGADFNLVVEPLARSLLFQGKYKEVIQLDTAKKLNKSSTINFELVKAEALIATNKNEKAEMLYQSIIQQKPKNMKANIGLANLYIDVNSLTKSKEVINKIEGFKKTDNEFLLLKGRWLLIKGNLTQALTLFEKANIESPDNVKTLKFIVNTYIGLKEYSKAELLIEEILILSPNDPHAQFLKSAILRDLDKTTLSEQALLRLSTQLSSIDSKFMDNQPQLQLIDAMTSYEQKRWEQARHKLSTYLEKKPDDISAVMLLADIHLKQNKGQDALKLLSHYEEELILNKDYGIILAGLYIEFNNKFKAERYLEALNKKYPNDLGIIILTVKVLSEQDRDLEAINLIKDSKVVSEALSLQALASLSLKLGKLDESQTYISSLIAFAPDNIEYQLLHAQLLFKQKNIEKATNIITQLYTNNPDNAEVQFNYAILQDFLGKKEIAKEALTQLVMDNKEHTEAWLKLADLEYQLGDVKSAVNILEEQKRNSNVNTKATYQLAELYFRERDFDKSLSLISEYLRSNRLDTYAIEIKAKNLIALRKPEAAKLQLEQLFDAWSINTNKLLRLSRLQLRIKDYKGAEKSLAVALELSPKNLTVFIETIKLQVKQNKLTEADNVIKLAEKAGFKENKYLLVLKGDVARGKSNLSAAYSLYVEALRKDENNIIPLIKLAQISQTDKLSKQFILLLTSLVNKNPDASLKRKILAEHLLTHEHWDAAQLQYQLLLTQSLPVDQRAIALNNLATIHIKKKDYKLAIIQAKQAIDITSTIPQFFDTTGWALTLSGDANEGLSYLNKAYNMSPKSIEVQYHLAYTLAKLGKKEKAIYYLEFIVRAPDDMAVVKLAKQLLLEIK